MEQKMVKLFTAQDNIQTDMIIDTLKDNNVSAFKEDLGNAGLMNLYGGNSKCGENVYVSSKKGTKFFLVPNIPANDLHIISSFLVSNIFNLSKSILFDYLYL